MSWYMMPLVRFVDEQCHASNTNRQQKVVNLSNYLPSVAIEQRVRYMDVSYLAARLAASWHS